MANDKLLRITTACAGNSHFATISPTETEARGNAAKHELNGAKTVDRDGESPEAGSVAFTSHSIIFDDRDGWMVLLSFFWTSIPTSLFTGFARAKGIEKGTAKDCCNSRALFCPS